MSKSRKDKAMMLDPDRFKIAQQNAVMPGGPPNQQNNPQNVQNVGNQPASMDGISRHPYGDTGNQYPQMGADVLNPMMVGRSQVPQPNPVGRGKNQQPFGMQQQPQASSQEPMEGMRLGTEAMNKGLNANPFMGQIGSPALMPGALDPTIPGSSASLNNMPNIQQMTGESMIPGSSPQKIQKKGKK